MIVMEFVDGMALEDLLKRGPLAHGSAVSYARQIALGMAEAHRQGVVHGDLKPGNIMVTQSGHIKIMDFGLARRKEPMNGQTTSPVADGASGMSGTPSYMSPEQVRGLLAVTASDVFSLGLILYEMTTGKRAVQEGSLLETLRQIDGIEGELLARDAPEPIATILRRTLVRHPPEIRVSMSEVVAMLSQQ
jgi:serine/threonine-protein kinase